MTWHLRNTFGLVKSNLFRKLNFPHMINSFLIKKRHAPYILHGQEIRFNQKIKFNHYCNLNSLIIVSNNCINKSYHLITDINEVLMLLPII